MQYHELGNTGEKVSQLCLGTMTWGQQNSEADAHEQLDYAVAQGINFVDVAEMYPVPPTAETQGLTEKYLGTWLAQKGNRQKVLVATKVTGRSEMFPYIRDGKQTLDRKNIIAACEASLQRLQTEVIDLNLVRDVIKIQSVRSQKESDIGYLRITSFSEQTFEKMRDELEKLRTEIPQMKGLVLDLRNNPGGLLDQAVEVSDAFLDRGEIVSTRGRQKEDIHRYSATAGDLLDGLPMVVLINAGSASASEIVAGAMQDHKRAVIMGNKSFGKGSVQTVIPLPGHGAMRLTTSRYYTPSGISIQAEGIVPDIEVDQAKIEVAEKNGRNIYESNLPGALSNDNSRLQQVVGKDKAMKDAELKSRRGESKDESVSGSSDSKKLNVAEDFQLARAIDLLRGLAVYKHQAPAVSAASVSVSAPQPVAESSEPMKTPAKAPTNPSAIKPAPVVKPVPEKTKP